MNGIPSFPVRRSRRSMSNETPSRRAAICSETAPEVLGNGCRPSFRSLSNCRRLIIAGLGREMGWSCPSGFRLRAHESDCCVGARVVSGARDHHLSGMKNLELSDEEAAVLARDLTNITWKDRHPLSPRIRVLEEILGMLRRRAWRRPGFNRVLSRSGSRLRLVLALLRADRPTYRSAGYAVGWVGERDRGKQSILAL